MSKGTKKSADDIVKELREMLDSTAEIIIKVMGNTNYLKEQQDTLKDNYEMLNTKLIEIARMVMVLVNESDNPKVTEKITLQMLSNKDFVEHAGKTAQEMDVYELIQELKSNPIFADDIPDLEDMTEEDLKRFSDKWEHTKEMFTLAHATHEMNTLEEE